LFSPNSRLSVTSACPKQTQWKTQVGGFLVFAMFTKICSKCREVKPISDFYKDKHSSCGTKSCCKACAAEGARKSSKKHYYRNVEEERKRSRNYQAEHVEERRAFLREWRRAHVDKSRAHSRTRYARKSGAEGKVTDEEWKALKEFYKFTCLRCKRKEPGIRLEPDHVVPLSKGGPNIIKNIQPLCRSCNSYKHDKYIDYR
jgi:5-methylcytosine-specific restriction endonuclease McrA